METLLQYTWKHKIFPLSELTTDKGDIVEIIDPGLTNKNAGPDFFNAKIKINGVLWVGNVEIHQYSSDWYRHQHCNDKIYDSVILHVAETIDHDITRTDGEPIPQLELKCPEFVKNNYQYLLKCDSYPPCHKIISAIPKIIIHSWMNALQTERLQQRTELLNERVRRCNGNWEDALFITLARNFGFGLNGDAFEHWANNIPLRAIDKHRNDLFQIESFFFGMAGILDEEKNDEYFCKLKKEYAYLSRKFELKAIDSSLWKFLRLRPNNFPHVRIAQLAYIYYNSQSMLSKILEAQSIRDIKEILKGGTSTYWLTHYTFAGTSASRTKTLSNSTLELLIINTISTFLYAYGEHRGNEKYCERAVKLLEEIKPEYNHIIRQWEQCGLKAQHAGDSQALIQLKKEYCDKKKCLYCRIGYEYLKNKRE